MLLSPSSTAFSLSKVDLRSDELLTGGGITAKEDGVSIQLSKDYENSKRIKWRYAISPPSL